MSKKNLNIITPKNDGSILRESGSLNYYFPLYSYQDGNRNFNKIIFSNRSSISSATLNKINNQSVKVSYKISKKISEIVFGESKKGKEILYYDYVRFFVETYLDKLLLQKNIKAKKEIKYSPKSLDFILSLENDISEFTRSISHLNPEFQWFLLRLLIGCSDKLTIKRKLKFNKRFIITLKDFIVSIINLFFNKNKKVNHIYYKRTLKRFKKLDNIGFVFQKIPNLMRPRIFFPNNNLLREKISKCFMKEIKREFKDFNIKKSIIKRYSDIFSKLMRYEILEDVHYNKRNYEIFFNRNKVKALLSTGSYSFSLIDQNFFSLLCIENNIPIITFQHGGMIGYEKSMPQYCTPMIFSDKFLSAGWVNFPKEYDNSLFKAVLNPMPNPYFSELKILGKKKKYNKKRNTILIPLSKDLVLDDKLGNNINAEKVVKLRNFIIATLIKIEKEFEKIIIIHRTDELKNTKLLNQISKNKKKYVVFSNKKKKVYEYFKEVDIVLWDVTSTGFIESLSYGIPTIALNSKERWSKSSKGMVSLLEKNSVIVNNSDDAASMIKKIKSNSKVWKNVFRDIKPFLDHYAMTDAKWKSKWRYYLQRQLND